MTVEELLKRAAELRGMPESLVERSAQARAKKEGIPVEQVLAEWAGVGEAATPAPEEAPAAAEPVPEAPSVPEAAPMPEAAPAGGEAVAEPPPAAEAESAPAPAAGEPAMVEVLEPAAPLEGPAGGEEPVAAVRSRYPLWLAATFVLIPLVAVLYIVALPNGPSCGSAGRLAVDPATGAAVNCDGTPYGVETVDNFASGETLFAANCAVCHGATGGGGSGPALAGGAVLVTFPSGSCADHRTWVTLGTAGWGAEIGDTYGATNKPVGGFGIMPGFGSGAQQLTELEIAQVAVYERVALGGQPLAEAEAECVPAEDEAAASGP